MNARPSCGSDVPHRSHESRISSVTYTPLYLSSGKDVGSPRLNLDIRIWVALDDLDLAELGGAEIALHLVGAEEDEVEIDRLLPPGVEVADLVADVKAQVEDAAGYKYPPNLAQHVGHVLSRDVDKAVEGDNTGTGGVGERDGAHGALPELDVSVQTAGFPDHLRRDVDADDVHAEIVEESCDMARTAAEIQDGQSFACRHLGDTLGEARQQFAVERFVGQLTGDPPGVFGGDAIVALSCFHEWNLVTGIVPEEWSRMRTFSFGRQLGRHISRFGSDFTIARLIHTDGMHVGCMYIPPNGGVGYHPATTYQLFAVIEGAGWVRAGDGERMPIRAGEAAFWEPGEEHEARTDGGMTAIVVEGDALRGDAGSLGPPG